MSASDARPPRILNVVTQLEPGGAQTVAFALHRELERREVPSSLLFLYEKSPEHFRTRDFTACAKRRPAAPRELLAMFAHLRRHWRAFRPTTIFAHTHYASAACALGKAAGAPGALVAVHQNPFDSYPAAARLLNRAAAMGGLYRGEISVSKAVSASLPPLPRDVARRTIPNCAATAHSDLSSEAARRRFDLPRDGFIIGAVGRLHPQKNHAFLVELLPGLPDAHLAIVGEGELRSDLAKSAERLGVGDRVSMIGAVEPSEVADFLRAINLFAMPSLYEGLSLAMLESMSMGLPFVGSDIPSLSDIAAPPGREPSGILAPLDAPTWIRAIRGLIDDPARRLELAERAVLRARDFSVEAMADGYLSFANALGR